jgi:DDE superfamily endonuclease
LLKAVKAAAEAHPDQRIALWFMDEARFGQKSRTTHRWWIRGQRPPGVCDKRFESASIFAAVRPSTGEDFALVRPWVSAAAMSTFLAGFAATVPTDNHVVMVLDQAGWHGAKDLVVPDGLTLVPLPSYSPELVWASSVKLYVISLPRLGA